MNTVDNILNRDFRAEAEKRGYIVIAPAAPDDQLFFEYVWHREMNSEAEFLGSKGAVARYTVEKGPPAWTHSREPTPDACSTGLRRPRTGAASKRGCAFSPRTFGVRFIGGA